MRDENKADRVQIVSGRGESETWKEVNASGLAQPFKTFRSVFAEELTTRFLLDTTPNKHIQLALKMNPAINTEPKGPLLSGKSAMHEMMTAEYKRALRRAALRRAGSSAPAPVPVPAAADEAEAEDAPWDAPAAAPAVAPAVAPQSAKRRKGLLGVVAAQQSTEVVEDGASRIDQDVQTEVERFNLISRDIITAGAEHKYYFSSERFNLRAFWADHKETLPLHYSVYVAEVGCKKAAAANVESVFSGAGKFTEEAKSAGHVLLSRMVRLHYNWNYPFLRPTIEEVVKRYLEKFHKKEAAGPGPSPTPQPSSGEASSSADAPAAPTATPTAAEA